MRRVVIIALIGISVQIAIIGAQFFVVSKERTRYVAYYPSMMGTKAQNDWMTSYNDVGMVRSPTTLPGMCSFVDKCSLEVQFCDERLRCRVIKRVYSDGIEERYP